MKKMITTLGILMSTQLAFTAPASALAPIDFGPFNCPAVDNPLPNEDDAGWNKLFYNKLIAANYETPQYSINIWEVSNDQLEASLNNMDEQVTIAGAGDRESSGARGQVYSVTETPVAGNGDDNTRVVYIVQWNQHPDVTGDPKIFNDVWRKFTELVVAYNWTTTKTPQAPEVYSDDLYAEYHSDLCDY